MGEAKSNANEVTGWEESSWKNGEKLKVASGLRILSPHTEHNNTQMRQKLDQIILETA